jgi:hypothetical protein
VILGLLAGGCASTTTQTTQTAPRTPPPPLPIAQADQSVSTNDTVLADASSVRLESIVDAMLFYFRINQGMPGALDDLKTVPEFGDQINTISPSGDPYVYVPQGLTAPNSDKRLVVYDPRESANGKRWCILVSQLKPGAPLTAEVLAIPEISFRAYLVSGLEQ